MPRTRFLIAATLLLAAACNKENPVLPTQPGSPSASAVTIVVTSDRGSLEANSQQPAMLTITAHNADGTAVTDGTDVAINTNLGNFGVDAAGKPVQLVTKKTAAGVVTTQFFAGDTAGTANILAQIGTNVGRLNLPIAVPAVAPVADFTFETNGLSAIFTSAATGSSLSYSWDFGDSVTSSDISPKHDYKSVGTYTVKLTVTNTGGSSSKSKFVTIAGGPPVVASFTFAANALTVLFTDTSTGSPTTWSWNFGDSSSDTTKNPQHVYAKAGTYTVKLTATNSFGSSASVTQFVTVGSVPVADFTSQTSGLKVIFNDTSTGAPTSWSWDFGDSGSDTIQNPVHTYAAVGTYNVTLTVMNSSGSSQKSHFVTVSQGDPPKAQFTTQIAGLQVIFTDASTNSPTSWDWDFGDNSTHATTQNATHNYANAGTYNVTLKVGNAAGSSTASTFVTVNGAPVADFSFTVASSNTLGVNFFDQSIGSPTAWAWNFGDCATSESCTDNKQNTAHVYGSPGVYSVQLMVSNSAGSSKVTKSVAAGSPNPEFTFQVTGLVVMFTDTSSPTPTTRAWDFGDCATTPSTCSSNAANPTHTYTASGTYNVRLSVANAGGSASISHLVTVP
jgi:PKD repeat protein